MHDVFGRNVGLSKDKNDRNFSIKTTGATSAAPGSDTEAIFIDYSVRARLCQLSVISSSYGSLLTLVNAFRAACRRFLAKSPPVYIWHVHLIDKKGPWYLGGPLVASFRKLDGVVKLQCSIEVGEFVVAIIDAGLNDLLEPWLESVERSEAYQSE